MLSSNYLISYCNFISVWSILNKSIFLTFFSASFTTSKAYYGNIMIRPYEDPKFALTPSFNGDQIKAHKC